MSTGVRQQGERQKAQQRELSKRQDDIKSDTDRATKSSSDALATANEEEQWEMGIMKMEN